MEPIELTRSRTELVAAVKSCPPSAFAWIRTMVAERAFNKIKSGVAELRAAIGRILRALMVYVRIALQGFTTIYRNAVAGFIGLITAGPAVLLQISSYAPERLRRAIGQLFPTIFAGLKQKVSSIKMQAKQEFIDRFSSCPADAMTQSRCIELIPAIRKADQALVDALDPTNIQQGQPYYRLRKRCPKLANTCHELAQFNVGEPIAQQPRKDSIAALSSQREDMPEVSDPWSPAVQSEGAGRMPSFMQRDEQAGSETDEDDDDDFDTPLSMVSPQSARVN